MSPSRPLQFGARLGLLAMWLLLVGPLLGQGLAPRAPSLPDGLPTWLGELSCSSQHEQRTPQPAPYDLPWAKCGYCTLLLGSPALASSTLQATLPVPQALPVLALAVQPVALPAPFPSAAPRAPPLPVS
ncbi:DUF2946 family protein [Aquipseudomonas alcaligenes]|uniref:DUF2946 family protein n=1 Tax=Aquipseudomonas alcaligenes TaxID=43263 RepID=UPI00223C36A9|nr:DUF2946 family protein [Pseudomonas alcaligenes]